MGGRDIHIESSNTTATVVAMTDSTVFVDNKYNTTQTATQPRGLTRG